MTNQKKPKTKPLRYFFYDGDLCKKIHIHRPNDVITAWNYRRGAVVQYVYSDVRRNGEQAYTTKQVCTMLNRGYRTVKRAVEDGQVVKPQETYGLDENRNMYKYMWSEKEIMGLWDYLRNVHYGRPRADGLVTPKELPTASELRAMIRQGTVFYVKVGDQFVPTWRAENF